MKSPAPRAVLALLFAALPGLGETGEAFFERRIRPILAERCAQCHGERIQSAGIDTRKPETLLGTAVISGDESSPLIRAVRYESAVKMPPSGKLAASEIRALVDWVRMGAPWPDYEPEWETDGQTAEGPVRSDHWGFQPIADPPVPDVATLSWPRNGIDAFVLARLRSAGLEPPPRAAPLTLLRRARFGLSGLPPTAGEVERFGANPGPGAFGHLADRLLASPQYGEHWGRHWLDVARFADSTGVDEDQPFGDSWRYRDYVVGAFNRDRPFDEFAREQIAGDLLPAPEGADVNARGIVATGFLAVGPMALAQRDPVQKRYDVVDEQIDTLSKAFLGLTIACARCHDHKFDPILTADYYALAGILASTRTFDDWKRDGSRYLKRPLVGAPTYESYRQRAAAVERLERILRTAKRAAVERHLLDGPAGRIAAAMLAAAGVGPAPRGTTVVEWFRRYLQPQPVARPHLAAWRQAGTDRATVAERYQRRLMAVITGRAEALDGWVRDALAAVNAGGEDELPESPADLPTSLLYRDLAEDGGPLDVAFEAVRDSLAGAASDRIRELGERIESARGLVPAEPPMANSVAEGEPVQQRIFRRGQHTRPGAAVPKRFPLVLAGSDQPRVSQGSGRRELAAWVSSKSNPLTARVIVNRVWRWHFGQGLVRTPNNLGTRGEAPTHPLLLDWLARRFVESGWSVKELNRLILNSATYQMSAAVSPDAIRLDPDNRLFSRFGRRRLSIEELRDSYLRIAGRLDWAVGGDTDLGSGRLPEFERNNRRIDPDNYRRRTLYLPLMRNKLPALLGLFDFGDATTSSGARSSTYVAPQALYLMNSAFAATAAEGASQQLRGTPAQRASQAYRLILGRPPKDREQSRAERYARTRADDPQAWASLCKLLLASNEFHHVE